MTTIAFPEVTIELQDGERYAGPVLDAEGRLLHHLILMPAAADEKLTWQAAMEWAKGVGGDLPDRQEHALLFANCKPHLSADWHWSNQTYESNASYAWLCHFNYGGQYCYRKSWEACARAVRRI